MQALLMLLLGLPVSSWACSCLKPIPPPTCRGEQSVYGRTSGFIGRVVEAESEQDLLDRILARLPKEAADRVRQLAADPDQEPEEEESLRLTSLLLPEGERQRFFSASREEHDKLARELFPNELTFRLQVVESFSKEFAGEIEVRSELTSCGLVLKKGEFWYLNPSSKDGKRYVAMCGTNRRLRFPDSEREVHQQRRDGDQRSRIEGLVLDSWRTDRPIGGAEVEARSANRSFTTRSNEAGEFELNGLPADEYQIRVNVRGRRFEIETVKLCAASSLGLWLVPRK